MLPFLAPFAIPAVIAVSGCSPSVRWPNLFHPGPAGYQRAIAERYDPYPSPDAGPEIVGGRPPGYQRPLSETEWGRRFARPDGALQPVPTFTPVPTVPPPPIYSSPTFPPAAATSTPPAAPLQQQRRNPY